MKRNTQWKKLREQVKSIQNFRILCPGALVGYLVPHLLLRKEWGFDGIVMSDWWATSNIEGEKTTRENKSPMVAEQNDLYMCVADSESNPENDNVKEALVSSDFKRSDLQRNAKNILNFIMKLSMLYELNLISEEELREINEKRRR